MQNYDAIFKFSATCRTRQNFLQKHFIFAPVKPVKMAYHGRFPLLVVIAEGVCTKSAETPCKWAISAISEQNNT